MGSLSKQNEFITYALDERIVCHHDDDQYMMTGFVVYQKKTHVKKFVGSLTIKS